MVLPPKGKVLKEKETTQHIQAFARMRPLNSQEIDSFARECVTLSDKEVIVNLPHGSKRYVFDKVFNSTSKQRDVYKVICAPIIKEVQLGYNCTIFAYGQTGTGKTYTMVGEETGPDVNYLEDSHSGIIPRALDHLFDGLKKSDEYDFTVRVSYLEIYNEVLTDLLAIDENKALKIYEDSKSKGSVQVHGLEEVTVFNKKELHNILKIGSEKKNIAATALNPQSSRSHTVFTITIHGRETTPDGEELVRTGKLNLVDLAGSENISKSGAIDKRAREAGNINQSLLTLGRVIKALIDKNSHIPYRESKLTRILQDSLGGKTKTTIIATFTAASNNMDETLNTLEYAFRSRNITIRPEVNQKVSKTVLVQNYLEQIERLKKDLTAAQRQEGIFLNPENYHMMLDEKNKLRDELLKSVEECSGLGYRIQELDRVNEEMRNVHGLKEKELQGAQASLFKFKKCFKDLRKQRRVQQDLIDRYDDAQKAHISHAKDLSEALDKYLYEHGMLRTKVDEFYNIQEDNHKSTKTLLDLFNDEHNKTVSAMKSWNTLVETCGTSFSTITKSFIDHKEIILEKFKTDFNFNKICVDDVANEITTNLKEEIQNYVVFKSLHDENVKSAALELIDKVVNDKCKKIFKSLDTINTFNNSIEEVFIQNSTQISNSVLDLTLKFEDFNKKNMKEFEEVQSEMSEHLSRIYDHNRDVARKMNYLLKQNNEYIEKYNKLSEMLSAFSNQFEASRPDDSFEDTINQSKRHLKDSTASVNQLKKHKQTYKDIHDNSIANTTKIMTSFSNQVSKSTQQTNADVKQFSKNIELNCQKLETRMNTIMADIKLTTDEMLRKDEELLNNFGQSLQIMDDNQEMNMQRLLDFNNQYKELSNELIINLKHEQGCLSTEMDNNISNLKTKNFEYIEEMRESINKQHSGFEAYYSNIKIAPQTGETPARERSFKKSERPTIVFKKLPTSLFRTLEEECEGSCDISINLPEEIVTDTESEISINANSDSVTNING